MRIIIITILSLLSVSVYSAPPFPIPPAGPMVMDCDLANEIDVPQYKLCLRDSNSDGIPDSSALSCGDGESVYSRVYGSPLSSSACISPANLPVQVNLIATRYMIAYIAIALFLSLGMLVGVQVL